MDTFKTIEIQSSYENYKWDLDHINPSVSFAINSIQPGSPSPH